jgi:hypothetical protein
VGEGGREGWAGKGFGRLIERRGGGKACAQGAGRADARFASAEGIVVRMWRSPLWHEVFIRPAVGWSGVVGSKAAWSH